MTNREIDDGALRVVQRAAALTTMPRRLALRRRSPTSESMMNATTQCSCYDRCLKMALRSTNRVRLSRRLSHTQTQKKKNDTIAILSNLQHQQKMKKSNFDKNKNFTNNNNNDRPPATRAQTATSRARVVRATTRTRNASAVADCRRAAFGARNAAYNSN